METKDSIFLSQRYSPVHRDTVFGDPEIGCIILQSLYTTRGTLVFVICYAVWVIFCCALGTVCHIELCIDPAKAVIQQQDLLRITMTAESGRMSVVRAENGIKSGGAQNGVGFWKELVGGVINPQQVIQML
jgi:hypothetical protein